MAEEGGGSTGGLRVRDDRSAEHAHIQAHHISHHGVVATCTLVAGNRDVPYKCFMLTRL